MKNYTGDEVTILRKGMCILKYNSNTFHNEENLRGLHLHFLINLTSVTSP